MSKIKVLQKTVSEREKMKSDLIRDFGIDTDIYTARDLSLQTSSAVRVAIRDESIRRGVNMYVIMNEALSEYFRKRDIPFN